ncbi:MAG: hypothetical protein QM489_00325 [Candidatus Izemoplasma sp.]
MRNASPVLPLREWVKGNTVQKLAKSAYEFFGGDMTGIITKVMRDTGKIVHIVVFTSGDGSYNDIGKYEDFQHDQTGRYITGGTSVGKFSVNEEGEVHNLVDCELTTKVGPSYTYK